MMDDEEEKRISEDPYSILNVDRKATDQEIRRAYRRFSRINHPDKQSNYENISKKQFNRIKKAYEILSDETKRKVYDAVGMEGVEQTEWKIIPKFAEYDFIKERYDFLKEEKKERLLRNELNARGKLNVSFDLSEYFHNNRMETYPPIDRNDFKYYPQQSHPNESVAIKMTGFEVSQDIDLPIDDTNFFTINCKAHASSTDGGKNPSSLRGMYRRIWADNLYWENHLHLGRPFNLGSKLTYRYSNKTNFSTGITFFSQRHFFFPVVDLNVSRRFNDRLHGEMSWKLGSANSLTTTVNYSIFDKGALNSRITGMLQLGFNSLSVALNGIKSFVNRKYRLRLSLNHSTVTGSTIHLAADNQLTKRTLISGELLIGSYTGVHLTLSFIRNGTHSINIPLKLCDGIHKEALFYGSLAPTALYFAIRALVVQPFFRQIREQKMKKDNERERTKGDEEHDECLQIREMLKETNEIMLKKEEEEMKKNLPALIIERAYYGNINEDFVDIEVDEYIDVTIPLQTLIVDHQLIIPKNNNMTLIIGFCDPCRFDEKYLWVKYRYVDDNGIILTKQKFVKNFNGINLP
ncbi:hypothetical protein SNEBB_009950 [Seison nebaliae]|nr:hypothetical protein SNEBB_009950 [Seison nebaliae]